MQTIHLEHSYPVTPDRLWALATDYDALAQVMKGLILFEGLPHGRTQTGQKVDVMVSLFGKLPAQPYQMEVLDCDDTEMILISREHGAGVKSWRHTLRVIATPAGSTLIDQIDIEAGWMTWAFAMWARYLYKARHKPRLRLLESGAY